MITIPEELIDSICAEVAELDPAVAAEAMQEIAEKQPALLAYVMAATEDVRPEAQEIAVYLFVVILRIFERVPDHHVKRVSLKQVQRRAGKNETTFEHLFNADDRFLERAAELRATTQPYVMHFLTAVLLDEDDDVELTEDESGLFFLVLLTVVELLDNALTLTVRPRPALVKDPKSKRIRK